MNINSFFLGIKKTKFPKDVGLFFGVAEKKLYHLCLKFSENLFRIRCAILKMSVLIFFLGFSTDFQFSFKFAFPKYRKKQWNSPLSWWRMTNSIPPLTALVQYLRKSSWSFGVTTGSLAVKLILLIGPLMPLNWGFFRFAGHSRAFSR